MEGLERYAVVSCHVERPLDDDVWARFERLLERRPAGFVVTPFLRPPDLPRGEDEGRWVERARRAAELAPLGHHTHWGGPEHARPPDGVDAAAAVRAEAAWLRERGLEPRFFCGGGWYLDAALARALAELGYVDCTATTFRQRYLAAGAPRLQLPGPARVELAGGRALLELPATHSLGMLARGLLRLHGLVHVHFHDWELADRRRALALSALLRALALRRRPLALDELARRAAGAPGRPWPAPDPQGATIAT
ncbi:MAG TPA: hypothetical protein VFA19_05370 [Gaiellaceae bacterium]|nr:hypothetical protein [Gaiellaceae bacterium]